MRKKFLLIILILICITVYGHLLYFFVRRDDYVRQGQVIGRVGKTGNARAIDMLPHLHFEVRENGVPQDPLEYS